MFEYDDFSYEFDSNGDGINDSISTYADLDNDGYQETMITQTDNDGDGYMEMQVVSQDTNLDGICDRVTTEIDTNNSGYADTAVVQEDTEFNGSFNKVTRLNDYNQDGEYDSAKIYEDVDGDGQVDMMTKIYDADGDGSVDNMEVHYAESITGFGSYTEMYDYDAATGQMIPTMSADVSLLDYLFAPNLDQYNPEFSDSDMVAGDPATAMEYWEYQGHTERCALYSQKFVIEELTGAYIDIDEFAEVATENGWFDEATGTTTLNCNQMLDYYGIDNEMYFHRTIDDLETSLLSGDKVIVSIDANETWFGQEHDIFAPDSNSNHAVEVIGIDRTDPDNPMVILNDSGSPTGRGEMIPLDVFENAWSDGDNQMIVCHKS